MNRILVNSLVLLAAAYGTWPVAAEEEDRGRHDRDFLGAKLFAANGKFVGKVVYYGWSSEGGVLLKINGVLVYAGINRVTTPPGSGLYSATQMQWSGDSPTYTVPNCSGTVYIGYPSGPFRPTATVRSGATAVLHIGSVSPQQLVTVRSENYAGTCYNYDYTYQKGVWTVESTFDLTQNYPEPLRIEP
ncbi:hypothetical protein [Caballeronia humi]|uniref:Lipoprotein n=1 Tax=Caballeronia humi TaxID=326474 RepID=A0A158I8I1_9BURK|nr:hypothetical protein [Caballeronia humi]SAL52569.1 hypothetical protein AWB65_04350 [Caballeronia humi]